MYHRRQRIFIYFFPLAESGNLFKVVQNCVFNNSGSIPFFFQGNTMQYEHKDTKDTRWQRIHTLWKRAAVTLFSSLSCLQHITLDSYIPCLTDLCKALWEVMLSYHRTMQWHEEHDKQEASPTGKRLYLCDRIYLYSDTICFLFWKSSFLYKHIHCLCAATERTTTHRGSRDCVRSYSHKLVFGASNSSSYFYLNCEKPLCVTCCLGQVSTLNFTHKTLNLLQIPADEKASHIFSFHRLCMSRLAFSSLSSYSRFISFVAQRKEWLHLGVWKEMRVLNVSRCVSAAPTEVVLKWQIFFSAFTESPLVEGPLNESTGK